MLQEEEEKGIFLSDLSGKKYFFLQSLQIPQKVYICLGNMLHVCTIQLNFEGKVHYEYIYYYQHSTHRKEDEWLPIKQVPVQTNTYVQNGQVSS